ncbi:Batten's disease protein Cln3 [Naviculisporaceae sp. PSN 640]
MNRSPSSTGLLRGGGGLFPMPGSPSSSWALFRARTKEFLRREEASVMIAFWLFGLINNVLYVIILSAAQDLVGSSVPKGVVLLSDVMPSFLTKLIAPYFIHRIPYAQRILLLVLLSSSGMLLLAFTPPSSSVSVKMMGVILASLSSGGGELSFLGMTHYFGPLSLAAWGSGTGGAGLVGAGLYVVMREWWGMSVKACLLVCAALPGFMVASFFGVLPRERLRQGGRNGGYERVESDEEARDREDDLADIRDLPTADAAESLLAPGPGFHHEAHTGHNVTSKKNSTSSRFVANLRRTKSLFFPYMLPLLLVYIAEYTINQGVSPTLLFPLDESPFTEFRSFYPFYGFLYQLGVFISRSSTPWFRIHHLYLPSLLQVGNLVLLTLHALWDFIPSVYLVFVVIFWEGLLGGAVYVNTFAEIMENVPLEEREFSLGATSVSDSGGICVAGFLGMVMEVWLCEWQVRHGRDWCRRIEVGG